MHYIVIVIVIVTMTSCTIRFDKGAEATGCVTQVQCRWQMNSSLAIQVLMQGVCHTYGSTRTQKPK